MLTDEPVPRESPANWSPFACPDATIEVLARPRLVSQRTFQDVLDRRRSSVGKTVDWTSIADLLWYSAGLKGYAQAGRAGLPIGWSASPSSGGLQSIAIVCISDDGSASRLYDPVNHAFVVLPADGAAVSQENRNDVLSVTGAENGCTLRLIGDRSKLLAAYENADSLLFRDAGAVLATICLCAEWLDLCACPLGFLGNSLLPQLDLPTDRFQAVGAIQISGKIVPNAPE